MTLIKTSILSAVATGLRILVGLITNKIIAIYVGPSGIAFLGQFQNFLQAAMSISVGTIESGVVKYTSQYNSDKEEMYSYWSTAIRFSLIVTVLLSILIVFFHSYLSLFLFQNTTYKSIFLIFALNLFLFVLNSFLFAVLNGLKEIMTLLPLQILGAVISLVSTGFLIYHYNLYGALLGMAINQSLIFGATVWFLRQKSWFKWSHFTQNTDKKHLSNVYKFALMGITSAIVGPTTLILIRNHIGETLSWTEAGYWQGVWRISEIYLMVIISTLSIYFLPKLSELQYHPEKLRIEILQGYKLIIPITLVIAVGIYLFRDFIILLIFTKDFLPMSELFAFQLIGDVIKMAGWLLGYLMLAKAMTKMYIFSEIVFNGSFFILSYFLINHFGLTGVTYAFMYNSLLSLLFLLFIFRGVLFGR
ncbi:MAG: O-antigen translocase [Sulfuricurvum sp.]|nr:O-antigen translocase [Sulfuricurvum sp.]